MRSAKASSTDARRRAAGARASPYRARWREAPGKGEPRAPVDAATIGVLLFVLACSLLRFGIFALRPERFGLDPALALLASAASAYYLAVVSGR